MTFTTSFENNEILAPMAAGADYQRKPIKSKYLPHAKPCRAPAGAAASRS